MSCKLKCPYFGPRLPVIVISKRILELSLRRILCYIIYQKWVFAPSYPLFQILSSLLPWLLYTRMPPPQDKYHTNASLNDIYILPAHSFQQK